MFLGAVDTVAAPLGTRGRCDLYSSRFLGWVKNGRGNVDVEAVESAAQVSASDGRIPLLFVSGGVLPEARQRADSLGIALLRYRAHDGTLSGANALGRQVAATGLA